MAVTSHSIFTSLSWIIWNPTNGLPNWCRSFAYARAISYAATACPSDAHATMLRVPPSTRRGVLKRVAPTSRFSSGTRQSVMTMSAFHTERSATLPSMTVGW